MNADAAGPIAELASQPADAQSPDAQSLDALQGPDLIPATAESPASAAPAPADAVMSQITSVSQLSDVQPTDWAYQALQSLVERYGCIAGYPDGTFKGKRALTRFEFAAGMNACLDRISELIASQHRRLGH